MVPTFILGRDKVFYALNPPMFYAMSTICPKLFKKYDHMSVYLFGYIFVLIFNVVAYILSNYWHLIFANEVSLESVLELDR